MSHLNNNIEGVGVGLRSKHFSALLEQRPNVPWVEVLTDNYLYTQGILLEKLQSIRRYYPMVLHGVGLSIGSTDAIDFAYLKEVKRLQDTLQATWISDHLCWTHHNNIYAHELLPLPFTAETIEHVVTRIKTVQDFLQQKILIENVSSYLRYQADTLFEAEFLAEIAERADCHILLDVNNIYVNSHNHGFDPQHYFSYLDSARIKQIHLGGYLSQPDLLIDTHGTPVQPPVWKLYQFALKKLGTIATNIEWDNDIPDWSTLAEQMALAQQAQMMEPA